MEKNEILAAFQDDLFLLMKEKLPCRYEIGRDMYYAYRSCMGIRHENTRRADILVINSMMRMVMSRLREPTRIAIENVNNVILTGLSIESEDDLLNNLEKAKLLTLEQSLFLIDIQDTWEVVNTDNVNHVSRENPVPPGHKDDVVQPQCEKCTEKTLEDHPFFENHINFSLERVVSFVNAISKIHVDMTTKILAFYMLNDLVMSRLKSASEDSISKVKKHSDENG